MTSLHVPVPRLRAALLLMLLALTACIDGTGPRPRPGAPKDEEPPGGNTPTLVWWEMQPRVISSTATDSVTFNVTVTGQPQEVTIQLRTGTAVTLQRLSATQFTARLSAQAVRFAYRSGDLHHAAGVITATGSGGNDEAVLLANIRDNTVPGPAPFTTLTPTMQASDHVVNIRHDAVNPGAPVALSVFRAFYELFGDDYDFIAVIEPVQSSRRPFFIPVRNAVAGLGLAMFDNGAAYGSAARLEGIVHYPVDGDFDLGRTDNIHELAHRWMNYLDQPLLLTRRPHWPLSTLARGIMGWSPPSTDEPFAFPWDLTRQADGTYLVLEVDLPRSFNDLELYLMGLLPPDSVHGHVVFSDQNQTAQLKPGGILRGPTDSVFVSDVILADGPRVPAAGVARRDLRVATIVLSRGGLLSQEELGFFEHMAVRGEQRIGLPYSDGVLRGTTLPFFLATGGRGTLTTRLRAVAGPQ